MWPPTIYSCWTLFPGAGGNMCPAPGSGSAITSYWKPYILFSKGFNAIAKSSMGPGAPHRLLLLSQDNTVFKKASCWFCKIYFLASGRSVNGTVPLNQIGRSRGVEVLGLIIWSTTYIPAVIVISVSSSSTVIKLSPCVVVSTNESMIFNVSPSFNITCSAKLREKTPGPSCSFILFCSKRVIILVAGVSSGNGSWSDI